MKSESNKNYNGKNILSGVLFGIGLMALIDEIVFHQLLQWHHFYDRSTPFIGILSDGLLNAFALFALVVGLFMFADLRRRNAAHMRRWTGGFLAGLGGFQLFDGIVSHKVLQIHQIRYVENLLAYDLAWNIAGAALLIIGLGLLFTAKNRRAEE